MILCPKKVWKLAGYPEGRVSKGVREMAFWKPRPTLTGLFSLIITEIFPVLLLFTSLPCILSQRHFAPTFPDSFACPDLFTSGELCAVSLAHCIILHGPFRVQLNRSLKAFFGSLLNGWALLTTWCPYAIHWASLIRLHMEPAVSNFPFLAPAKCTDSKKHSRN